MNVSGVFTVVCLYLKITELFLIKNVDSCWMQTGSKLISHFRYLLDKVSVCMYISNGLIAHLQSVVGTLK